MQWITMVRRDSARGLFVGCLLSVITTLTSATSKAAESGFAQAETIRNQPAQSSASDLFNSFQDRLYQIRTIDKASGSKSSIGSGFAIAGNGLLVTNYHVVSSYVLDASKYQLEAVDSQLTTQPLTVLSVDVINDLALVKLDQPSERPFLQLANQLPEQGAQIYSLGNPHDLGMTVVPGTFNGFTANSYYNRILFSGSINPGMSGGPVLDASGNIIGVNVATSGNQISFVVPLAKLKTLTESYDQSETRDNPTTDFSEQIHQQLKSNQSALMAEIFAGDWESITLGDSQVVGEITPFLSCWGESNAGRKDKFKEVFRRCNNKEYIYIAPDFYTGIIELEFYWYQSDQLGEWPFYQMLTEAYSGVSAGNQVSEKHVTKFQCQQQFTQSGQASGERKSVYCVRSYKQFPDLFDVLFLAASVDQEDRSLISHYTVAGVDQTQAQTFLKQFMEQVQ